MRDKMAPQLRSTEVGYFVKGLMKRMEPELVPRRPSAYKWLILYHHRTSPKGFITELQKQKHQQKQKYLSIIGFQKGGI